MTSSYPRDPSVLDLRGAMKTIWASETTRAGGREGLCLTPPAAARTPARMTVVGKRHTLISALTEVAV